MKRRRCARGGQCHRRVARDRDRDVDRTAAGRIRTTKGIHIVCRALTDRALVLFSGVDRRLLFAIPRAGLTWIGTTDTDFAGDPADRAGRPAPTSTTCCDRCGRSSRRSRREDVLYTTAGVRALVKAGGSESSVSRMHSVVCGTGRAARSDLGSWRQDHRLSGDRGGGYRRRLPSPWRRGSPLHDRRHALCPAPPPAATGEHGVGGRPSGGAFHIWICTAAG